MNAWTSAELRTLARLRDGFLSGSAGGADYWGSASDLELYDRTFAQRIGWKWDAVLGELSLRGWTPPLEALVDWGCGTGIASRRVLAHWPGVFRSLHLWDRSHLALSFASDRVREVAPGLAQRSGAVETPTLTGSMLLVSHVLTELSEEHMERLRKVALAAGALIWVESATHQNARRFMEQIREKLLETGQWRVVAPCTHSGSCPMLPPEHARHWCHHFARVPSEVHQSAAWRELSKKLGVDLRVLPYSFLAMERIAHESPAVAPGFQRIIGEPREFKGHLRILQCGAEGLAERALQKRDAPALFKRLRSAESLPLYRWDEQDGRITGGHGVGDGPEAGSAAERT